VSGVKRLVLQNHDVLHFPYFSCKSAEKGEPTSGLEPLTPAHYEWSVKRCRDVQRVANPAYLSGFLFSGLLSVVPYRVPDGVRVVSK
jgi:hypothetical protein